MREWSALLAAIGAAVVATPVSSQTFQSWSGSNYDVDALEDMCAMSSTFNFDGRLPVRFMLLFDGEQAGLFLTSMEWSAISDERYSDVAFVFFEPDASYDGAGTIGYVDGARRGFMGKFGAEVLDDFARSRRMVVTRGEGENFRIVTDLDLVGSSEAVSALRRCASIVHRQVQDRRRREAQWDHVERDPFAE